MLKRILKSKKGESLVETLCAVLIFTMASVALYTMILSANRTNTTVKQKDVDIQSHIVTAEQAPDAAAQEGSVTITIASTGTPTSFPVDVWIYGDDSGDGLYSFFKK